MKKETLVEKLARKAFESGEIQKSWKVHMQAFGPILEPAFADDHQARIDLTAALNKISRRDLKGGVEKLQHLQGKCVSDADRAAWLFFMGVCYEMAGAKQQMLSFYQQANALGHKLYLPYLKVAKTAQADMVLEVVEANYRSAIACLKAAAPSPQNQMILASAHTNLAGCLTMMHRLPEAFAELEVSAQLAPALPGRSGTAAIAHAAAGDIARAGEALVRLQEEAPQMYPQVQASVEKLLAKTHPHFFPQPMEEAEISAFWAWFLGQKALLEEKIAHGDFDGANKLLHSRMAPLFAFSDKAVELALEKKGDTVRLSMADFFSVGLSHGYQQLLDACPEEAKRNWEFAVVR